MARLIRRLTPASVRRRQAVKAKVRLAGNLLREKGWLATQSVPGAPPIVSATGTGGLSFYLEVGDRPLVHAGRAGHSIVGAWAQEDRIIGEAVHATGLGRAPFLDFLATV